MAEWEQPLPKETGPAYAAFCRYRDLGPGRSVDEAWRRHTGQQPGSSKRAARHWFTWSETHDWVSRAAAYDAEIERRARLKAEKETVARRAKMIEQHRQAGELLRQRGVQYYTKNEVDSARDATQAIRAGIDIERQADGQPDWVIQNWVIQIVNAPDEDLDELIRDLDARRQTAAGSGADGMAPETPAERNGQRDHLAFLP